MNKVLLFLAFSASAANASVHSYRGDPGAIRPIHASANIEAATPCVRAKPMLLFLKFPDGRIMLMGVFTPKSRC